MEKYGLLEEHEMDSIIADSNEKTVASDVAHPQLLVQQQLVVL